MAQLVVLNVSAPESVAANGPDTLEPRNANSLRRLLRQGALFPTLPLWPVVAVDAEARMSVDDPLALKLALKVVDAPQRQIPLSAATLSFAAYPAGGTVEPLTKEQKRVASGQQDDGCGPQIRRLRLPLRIRRRRPQRGAWGSDLCGVAAVAKCIVVTFSSRRHQNAAELMATRAVLVRLANGLGSQRSE